MPSPYIGRFAPSPSGPLHMGSLVCAVASYLDAKHNQGKWLVRIDDIDPPREVEGASEEIIQCLSQHGLHWDGEPTYQRHSSDIYQSSLDTLHQHGWLYRCDCTRKRLKDLPGGYDGFCRERVIPPSNSCALRLNLSKACIDKHIPSTVTVTDDIQEAYTEQLLTHGDIILQRKDGLFAYQLAVVVEDIHQGITHSLRGADLYDTVGTQQVLTKILGGSPLSYSHIPVLSHEPGKKLSKQHHAPAVDNSSAAENIFYALTLLRQSPPSELSNANCETLLAWAIPRWQPQQLAGISEILVP